MRPHEWLMQCCVWLPGNARYIVLGNDIERETHYIEYEIPTVD